MNKQNVLRAGGLNDEKPAKREAASDPDNQLRRPDEFDFDFLELYMQDPFLGGVSLDITKDADPNCPTAYIGVRKNGGRMMLSWVIRLSLCVSFPVRNARV